MAPASKNRAQQGAALIEGAIPSGHQGDSRVDHLETHALVVALRAAAWQSGGGGEIAALGDPFVKTRGDQFTGQAAATGARDGAVGKQRGAAARKRGHSAPRRTSDLRRSQ